LSATFSILTFFIGIFLGYIGQRSGMCFIGGVRDLYLLRDRYLIKGLIGALITAVVGFRIAQLLGGNVPGFPLLLKAPGMGLMFPIILSIVGGLSIGFFSVFAGGCPFRMHIMASKGNVKAIAYALGFALGALYFYAVVVKYIDLLIGLTG